MIFSLVKYYLDRHTRESGYLVSAYLALFATPAFTGSPAFAGDDEDRALFLLPRGT
jgi:hypothetical protein